jgi:formylglycine-generating enzyme required for sulfatase activity
MDNNRDLSETTAGATPGESPRVPASELPAEIGRYRVILLLGQGSFGQVYLAHDVDIDRQVAIKIPNIERISRPEDAEAFLAEARLVARLDHPHIVPVHDVGRTADGLCYMVSKFIEGCDLATMISQGPVELAKRVELAAALAAALHHAHTRGLVHRDLKPAILFHPDTSIRRSLILALGAYGTYTISPGERGPLIAKLLDLYENDPDAGLHGAAEWTLRQWEQAAKLKEITGRLKGKDKGPRRCFVNSQGQTFAVIDGPVEFRMGSPPTEPERDADETPHLQLITHRFAIADKEVTVEQYQQFVRENPRFGVAQGYLGKLSPGPNGPMIGVSWFGAAAYCNWLSQKEGLPRDQWCYLPNERDEYDSGMRIPADALERTGYCLPIEAEWEYGCRAGTATSRYHGVSVGLLEAYARYEANGKDHAWPGGACRPTTWGYSICSGMCLNGARMLPRMFAMEAWHLY